MTPTSAEQDTDATEGAHRSVTVIVNTKPVELTSHRVNGLQIKEAAKAQGVELEFDFQLTEEARDGHPARIITDAKEITVTKHSSFTANDVDDDS
jgi:hypothetical protein